MNRIFDPIYGYIELDEVEFKLVNSPLFQRLHWIKQLGPLNTVFPSAQHSRFSHSIGVFHIMKKMLKHLTTKHIPEGTHKILELAALLHDIGHVPLSHIGEKVLEHSYKPHIGTKKVDINTKPVKWQGLFNEYGRGATKLHEFLSAEIVLNNTEIETILTEVWREPKERKGKIQEIAEIIKGKHKNPVLNMMLHSELDADRLDYLLRDSFFTGVEYGKIDLDYIISRFLIKPDSDGKERLCVEEKGLHTIEHYTLGRFFLNTQVIFNRKVGFIDLVYKEVMDFLTNETKDKNYKLMNLEEVLKCFRHKTGTPKDRSHLHRVYEFTDAMIFIKMRLMHDKLDKKEKSGKASDREKYINDCIKTIMDGNIPDPVLEVQVLIPLDTFEKRQKVSSSIKETGLRCAEKIASKMGIYKDRLQTVIREEDVTKYFAPSGLKPEQEDTGASNEEAVRLYLKNTEQVEFAAKDRASILFHLTNKRLVIFRVYYINPKKEAKNEIDSKSVKIEASFKGFRRKIESFQQSTKSRPCRS